MKTLKKNTIALLLTTFLFLGLSQVHAQQKQNESSHANSKGPHGGKVEKAGTFYAEALIKEGKAMFYLLDGKANTLPNSGVTGSVMLMFPDGSMKTITLIPEGSEGFVVNEPKAVTYTQAVVAFKMNSKTVTAKFNAVSSAADEHSGHRH
ncbi:hypothetical protein PV783_17215 [Chitinophaga sp. CC14]|uniref:hypothetical protein n=1 Tax=Chitinophaga sp. CC14 TaxID=3029199 RepID=UPI003B78BC0A